MTRQQLKESAKEQLGRNIFGTKWLVALLVMFISSAILSFAGGVIVGVGLFLVSGPISYGVDYVFLKQSRDGETMDIGEMFSGFTNDITQNLLLGLISNLFIVLWSLLLVIPGIVKAYSYSMIYYIKADHPEYDWRTCMEESKRLTKGKKMDLFILDLSFIGWEIIGAMCFGIGVLWVEPYKKATHAQFYKQLILQ